MEALMEGYGIDYGYGYDAPTQKSSGGRDPRSRASIEAYRNRCRYWQDCYEPVFNGDYGLEIGTPIGVAYEFNTAGNSWNLGADAGGCLVGCLRGGPEAQHKNGEWHVGVNVSTGVGVYGKAGTIGAGIWAGTEFTTVSNQPDELTVSHSNVIHGELIGFSLELNYTPKVFPK